MSGQATQSKEITIGLMLSWIFGTLFALIGIVSVFSDPAPGLVMLVMAAVLLPPITKLVDQKWKFNLSRGMKIGVIVIGLIIFGMVVNTATVSNTQQTKTQEEEQFTDNENIINEIAAVNQIDEEQPQIKTNAKQGNEMNIIPAPDEEKAKIAEETKSSTSANTDRSMIPTKIEDKSEPVPSETVSQRNAVRSAKAYLDYSAFSREGLIEQLKYEKFSQADSVYGADNSGADWYEQAAKSAKQYMAYSAFSRGSLIEQLKHEKFTQAQAEHGANAVGL